MFLRSSLNYCKWNVLKMFSTIDWLWEHLRYRLDGTAPTIPTLKELKVSASRRCVKPTVTVDTSIPVPSYLPESAKSMWSCFEHTSGILREARVLICTAGPESRSKPSSTHVHFDEIKFRELLSWQPELPTTENKLLSQRRTTSSLLQKGSC